jgi:glutamate N-acetyltransferase/amino-acid N-acetyltransferase
MIEPNMATMLGVLLTDARISRSTLQRALEEAVNAPGSLNSITIDSDTSTSDAVVVLASNIVGPRSTTAGDSAHAEQHALEKISADQYDALVAALSEVCTGLAEDVVRNGEGVQHVVRVRVSHAPSETIARAVGKSIANSPLIKCAIAADDGNVGRIAMAIGKAAMHNNVDLEVYNIRVAMGGTGMHAPVRAVSRACARSRARERRARGDARRRRAHHLAHG